MSFFARYKCALKNMSCVLIILMFSVFSVKAISNVNGKCVKYMFGSYGHFQSPNSSELREIFKTHNSSSPVLECKWTVFPSHLPFKLSFSQFNIGKRKSKATCDSLANVTVKGHRESVLGKQLETVLCGSGGSLTFYSSGTEMEVILRGSLLDPSFENNSFNASYETMTVFPAPAKKCGPCGGLLNRASGMIKSPNFPKQYPNNCDCKWTIYVTKGFIIKLKFWQFSLQEKVSQVCHDYIMVYDGSSTSSNSLGKFCGNQNPGSLRTTGNYAFLYFHSDASKESSGFEIVYESSKDEEDLSSLRSIAAILGGISFGIFIFLLLCSIIYKRYVSNDERRDSCAPNNPGENDYLDAVQAAAPPSYQTVMADPEHYPRTPEITPAASPSVTPSLLRRNMITRPSPLMHVVSHHLEALQERDGNGVETPPPAYPGNVVKTFDNEELLIDDLPPPPSYEAVSDVEDHDDEPASTWAPINPAREDVIDSAQAGQTEPSNNSDTDYDSNGLVMLAHSNRQCSYTRRVETEQDDEICIQCIENSEIDGATAGVGRHTSEGDLRGRYTLLATASSETANTCQHSQSQPLRRRQLPPARAACDRCKSGGACHNHNTNTRDKRRKNFSTHKDRSFSVPSLASRHENSNSSRPSRSHTSNNQSPITRVRSLFMRQRSNHFNRIQPNESGNEADNHNETVSTESNSARNSRVYVDIEQNRTGSAHL